MTDNIKYTYFLCQFPGNDKQYVYKAKLEPGYDIAGVTHAVVMSPIDGLKIVKVIATQQYKPTYNGPIKPVVCLFSTEYYKKVLEQEARRDALLAELNDHMNKTLARMRMREAFKDDHEALMKLDELTCLEADT